MGEVIRHPFIFSSALVLLNKPAGTKPCQLRIDKELIEEYAHGFLMEKLKSGSCTVKHIGFFVFLMEKNRSLRWAESFGLPRKETMRILGIKNRRTYYNFFHEMKMLCLVEIKEESNSHEAVRISIMTQDFADYIASKNNKK